MLASQAGLLNQQNTTVFSFQLSNAGIAQLVEHLTCNQGVAGSTPVTGSISPSDFPFLKKSSLFSAFCILKINQN